MYIHYICLLNTQAKLYKLEYNFPYMKNKLNTYILLKIMLTHCEQE